MDSRSSAKCLRSACESSVATHPGSAAGLARARIPTAYSPPPPPPPSPSTLNGLPRALQSYALSHLDQVGSAAIAQTSSAWRTLAALPTSAPAALRLRPKLATDANAPGTDRLPPAFWRLLRRSASVPATSFGGVRSLTVTMVHAAPNEVETAALGVAIRALPSLDALELGGSTALDALVHAVVFAPVTGVGNGGDDDARLESRVLPTVRSLTLGSRLAAVRIVDIANAFPSLTRLAVSPAYLSQKMPSARSSSPPPPRHSFAAVGSERQWQNWRALSLFAHLERLTLPSENARWHVDVQGWEMADNGGGGGGDATADELQHQVAREEALMCDAHSAAAALRDRSRDRRPRVVPAFSAIGELEVGDWTSPSARPLFNLARHLPRLARLVLRQCDVGSPAFPARRPRDLVANLAELSIERTRDCAISTGVDFALRHTDVGCVAVHSLLRPNDARCTARCTRCTELPAAVCTPVTVRNLNNFPDDPESVAADAALVAASSRALAVHYHYDPDACRCEFASPPNISFVRRPTTNAKS